MRVLMLTDLYPPFIGGIEQHVRNLSHGLRDRGHDVAVVTMSGPDSPAVEDDGGIEVHRIRGTAQRVESVTSPQGRPHSPPFPDPGVVRALGPVLARHRPDIVHAHNWMVRSYLPLKGRNYAPLVMTLHDYGIICAKRSLWLDGRACSGPAFRKCLRCAAANYGTARGTVIALGNWAMQPMQRSRVEMFLPVSNAVAVGNDLVGHDLPYEVLPNFVPDDVAQRSDPHDPALAALPREPFWLYVGALSRHKGVHVLIEAYRGLSNAPPLVMIGPAWHDTPIDLPPNTTVIPSLSHAGVMAAWGRAALGIVPSVFPDPCPTVAMEAMSCGLALVGSQTGGLPDLIADGETGLLVEAGNPVALRAALARLMADPSAIDGMGRAALLKVASFTASAVVDRLENIYSEVLAARA